MTDLEKERDGIRKRAKTKVENMKNIWKQAESVVRLSCHPISLACSHGGSRKTSARKLKTDSIASRSK